MWILDARGASGFIKINDDDRVLRNLLRRAKSFLVVNAIIRMYVVYIYYFVNCREKRVAFIVLKIKRSNYNTQSFAKMFRN